MFGYLVANRPELKIREYDRYRRYYCGVCRALKEVSGAKAQISISYDMAFVAMLLAGLYEPETNDYTARCAAHMGRKMHYLSNPYIDYAAEMNLLLTYYKCIDDWHDDKKPGARAMQLALKKSHKRLKEKYPEKVRKLAASMKRIWELESMEGEVDNMRLDDLCVEAGRLMEAIIAPHDDVWKSELELLGFSLGKYIYLLDAYDDLEKDIKKGDFNPLIGMMKRPDFDEWIERMLLYTAADATAAFERLPILQDAEIIRNILYAGIWTRFHKKKNTKKED